jgi:hypothetical protein
VEYTGIIIACIALAGTIYGGWNTRRRTHAEAVRAHAEAEATVAEMATSFAAALRKEIDAVKLSHRSDIAELTARITDLEDRNFMYRKYIGMLISQLQGANIVPVEPPEPWPD